MKIIHPNPYPDRIPDFGNLGVMLRILLLGNLLVAMVCAVLEPRLADAARLFVQHAALLQPMLIVSLVLLSWLRRPLARLPYLAGCVLVLMLELALAALLLHAFGSWLHMEASWDAGRVLWLTGGVTWLILAYFRLRQRALSPALTEARLQALQARIRPHFLFNSLNAVISLIRDEPRRAETVLENLADLFRVLMQDHRELSSLRREVELARHYLDIEQLRLGERLQVEWLLDKMPDDAQMPALVLQPLLENAVYHGIEPLVQPGVVSIQIYRKSDQLHVVIRNPYCAGAGVHHGGNKMALSNIRERLALHFDAEAQFRATATSQGYQVHVVIPYREVAR